MRKRSALLQLTVQHFHLSFLLIQYLNAFYLHTENVWHLCSTSDVVDEHFLLSVVFWPRPWGCRSARKSPQCLYMWQCQLVCLFEAHLTSLVCLWSNRKIMQTFTRWGEATTRCLALLLLLRCLFMISCFLCRSWRDQRTQIRTRCSVQQKERRWVQHSELKRCEP